MKTCKLTQTRDLQDRMFREDERPLLVTYTHHACDKNWRLILSKANFTLKWIIQYKTKFLIDQILFQKTKPSWINKIIRALVIQKSGFLQNNMNNACMVIEYFKFPVITVVYMMNEVSKLVTDKSSQFSTRIVCKYLNYRI